MSFWDYVMFWLAYLVVGLGIAGLFAIVFTTGFAIYVYRKRREGR
jgi:uncharacterized SAM-binding protein YcdF (DUF218 family)